MKNHCVECDVEIEFGEITCDDWTCVNAVADDMMEAELGREQQSDSDPTPLPGGPMNILTVVQCKAGFAIDFNNKEVVRLINQRALFAHLRIQFGMAEEAIYSLQLVLIEEGEVSINLDHVGAA